MKVSWPGAFSTSGSPAEPAVRLHGGSGGARTAVQAGIVRPSTSGKADAIDAQPALHRGLSQRQLNMIAIGGVIGAGLFVGSSVAIRATGPAAFLTYAL